jgi:abhydrolase domain-containing protein 12
VFLPLVRSYFFRSRDNLLTPAKYGLENAENFYIPNGNATLGAWYLWPANTPYTPITNLQENSTLIIYMHGNSMDRGFSHRVELYKVLTSMGFHIITFDYRSYGDSSHVELSEDTVVEDGKAVLTWVTDLYRRRSADSLNLSGLSRSQ